MQMYTFFGFDQYTLNSSEGAIQNPVMVTHQSLAPMIAISIDPRNKGTAHRICISFYEYSKDCTWSSEDVCELDGMTNKLDKLGWSDNKA